MKCAACGHKGDHDGPEGCTALVYSKTWDAWKGSCPCGCKEKTVAPLRRVLGLVGVPVEPRPGAARIPKELYECGHARTQKEDIYGPTNAFRRRCLACARGEAPDPELLKRAQAWQKGAAF